MSLHMPRIQLSILLSPYCVSRWLSIPRLYKKETVPEEHVWRWHQQEIISSGLKQQGAVWDPKGERFLSVGSAVPSWSPTENAWKFFHVHHRALESQPPSRSKIQMSKLSP